MRPFVNTISLKKLNQNPNPFSHFFLNQNTEIRFKYQKKSKSIEASGASRNEEYFLSKISGL